MTEDERKAWEWRVMWAREISSSEPSHEYLGNEQLVKDILAVAAHLAELEGQLCRAREVRGL